MTQCSRPRMQKTPKPRPRTNLLRTEPLKGKDRNASDQSQETKIQFCKWFPNTKKKGHRAETAFFFFFCENLGNLKMKKKAVTAITLPNISLVG